MPVLERIFAILLSLSEKTFLVLRGILLTSVQPTASIVLHIHNNILCFVLHNHIFCIENTFICTYICSLRKTRVEGKLLSQSVEYFYVNSVLWAKNGQNDTINNIWVPMGKSEMYLSSVFNRCFCINKFSILE